MKKLREILQRLNALLVLIILQFIAVPVSIVAALTYVVVNSATAAYFICTEPVSEFQDAKDLWSRIPAYPAYVWRGILS